MKFIANRNILMSFIFLLGASACLSDKTVTDTSTPQDTQDTQDPFEDEITGCDKFDNPMATISGSPGSADGDLLESNRSLAPAEGDCVDEYAPYGIMGEGPEEVIKIEGLNPGTSYLINLIAESDLLFYVANDCTGGSALASDDCLVFVDDSVGTTEYGSFVAQADGVAYVVVDYWDSGTPDYSYFAVMIEESQCSDTEPCEDEVCSRGMCIECLEDSDCSADLPFCSDSNECVGGYDACDSDDEREHSDDSVTWATDMNADTNWEVVDDSTSRLVYTGKVCAAPYDENNGVLERDYFSFTVENPGEHWSFALAWGDSSADLDLYVFDEEGNYLGITYWMNPEEVTLTYLPAGKYIVNVYQYSGNEITAPVDYNLEVTRMAATQCESVADCASEYSTQYFRGSCNETTGACESFVGDGMVEPGGLCDSNDDCTEDSIACTAWSFIADADEHAICSIECTSDDDCGDNVCMTWSNGAQFCAPPCEMNEHCSAQTGEDTNGSAIWVYAQCDTATGQCDYSE